MAEEIIGRPVGGTEYSWCRAVPGGTGTTVIGLLLSQPIPITVIQTALHKLHNSHPILRACLTIPRDKSHPFISIPSPDDSHPILESLDAPATAAILGSSPDASRALSSLHILLVRELNRNPWTAGAAGDDSETRPIFYATVYELPQPGGRMFTLRLHTGLCDRTATVHVLRDLLGFIGNNEESEGHCGKREDGIISGIEELIPKQDAWKPFWARGLDLIGYSLNGLRSAGIRFEQTGPPSSSEMVRLVLSRDDTRHLLDVSPLKRKLRNSGNISEHIPY